MRRDCWRFFNLCRADAVRVFTLFHSPANVIDRLSARGNRYAPRAYPDRDGRPVVVLRVNKGAQARALLRLDEAEQFLVDPILQRRAQTVRRTLDDLEGRILDELRGQQG